MDGPLLLKGLFVGFAVAVPVGPVGFLCMRRTLAEGRACGLVSGLGAATADALCASIAAFGTTFVYDFLVGGHGWLRLMGGVFLCYLGLRTVLSEPREQKGAAGRSTLLGAYASAFFLTLANPLTILSFAALFAGLGLSTKDGDYVSTTAMAGSVFVGSSSWWVALSGGTGLLRDRLDSRGLRWANRVAGAAIIAFGVLALVGVI